MSDVFWSLSNAREMDAQFVANEQNNNCTQRREQDPGGVIAFVCRPREYVRHGPADDGTNNAEHDGPEDGHMDVHPDFAMTPAIRPTRIYQMR